MCCPLGPISKRSRLEIRLEDRLEFLTGRSIEAEINQAFDNVASMLNAVGLDWKNVAHVNSYHVPEPDGTILGATAEMAGQFRRRMPDHQPIWTCLGVAVLGDPKMRVEIRVTAFRDDTRAVHRSS